MTGLADAPSLESLYRRSWLAAAYSAELDAGPVAADVLGERLVLARLDGAVVAFVDRCPHRGTALSQGRVMDGHLVCGNHGWSYNGEGRCTLVPSQPDLPVPTAARLRPVEATESVGIVWVCLDPPAVLPLPVLPELTDPSYKIVTGPVYDWEVSSARRVENYTDFAHFAWVHDGLLGSHLAPEVVPHGVERRGSALWFEYEWPAAHVDELKRLWAGADIGALPRRQTYHITMPLTVHVSAEQFNGGHYVLFMTSSPLSMARSRNFFFIVRDFELDLEDDFWRANEMLILSQDQPIVESQTPKEIPLDPRAEIDLKRSDAVSVAYRRWLAELAGDHRNEESAR